MSHILLLIQSLNPFLKFCLWALIIEINVSVAICQLPIREFSLFGKKVYFMLKHVSCNFCFFLQLLKFIQRLNYMETSVKLVGLMVSMLTSHVYNLTPIWKFLMF